MPQHEWTNDRLEPLRVMAMQVNLGLISVNRASEILRENYFPGKTLKAVRSQLYIVRQSFDSSSRSKYYAQRSTRCVIAAITKT